MIHPQYWSLDSIWRKLHNREPSALSKDDIAAYSLLPVRGKVVLDIGAYDGDTAELFLRLDQPLHVKKPAMIGCCFMGDFFDPLLTAPCHGVPGMSIGFCRSMALDTIRRAYWHTFLMFTKQPQNITGCSLCFPENLIMGVSVNTREDLWRISTLKANYQGRKAVSFEPLLEDLGTVDLNGIEWVIIGAQTRPEIQPDPGWVRSLVEQAREAGVRKITYKDNLKEGIR